MRRWFLNVAVHHGVDESSLNLLAQNASEDVKSDHYAERDDEKEEEERGENDDGPSRPSDGAAAAEQRREDGDNGDDGAGQRQRGKYARLDERPQRLLVSPSPDADDEESESGDDEERVEEDEEEADESAGAAGFGRHLRGFLIVLLNQIAFKISAVLCVCEKSFENSQDCHKRCRKV